MSNMRGTIPESLVDDIQTIPISDGVNPEPIVLEHTDILVNDFLSPSRLEEISGRSDLENITMMEMVVNTTETTMGNFGSYLPRLKYLKLSNSVIPSVRDIGTSLSHLKVLWMSCCGLHDVDGIASLISLAELYLSYNSIEDISPIAFMDELQVLDLEGNQISEKEQFDYLSMLSKLGTLGISGNPVCQIINKDALNILETNSFENSIDTMTYREYIMKKLPQLKYIDDEKCDRSDGNNAHSSSDRPSTASLAASSHSQEDIELISNAIKEGLITEEETAAICLGEELEGFGSTSASNTSRPMSAGKKRPGSALSRPSTATPLGRSIISPLSRPQTSSSSGRAASAGSNRTESVMHKAANAQRPNSSGSEVYLEDESSTLTFGEVICGNPIKALRARKVSPLPVLNLLKSSEVKRPATAAPFSITNSNNADFNIDNEDYDSKSDALSDLKKWRAMHEERLRLKENDVQILRLDNDTASEEISLNSDEIDSEHDEILDLDVLERNNVHYQENIPDQSKVMKRVGVNKEVSVNDSKSGVRACSPPPKNLSPASASSSRSSSRSPASPLFSSAQFDSATIPVLKGASKPRTPISPDSAVQHVPAPPRVGAPRPRTSTGVRIRRSLVTNSTDMYMPLASPMVHPHSKRTRTKPIPEKLH